VSDDHAKPKLVAQQGLVDFALWSDKRIQAYKKSLGLKIDRPLGVLSIPRLQISAPVYDGTDDLTLDRGLGRIIGTGVLGDNHNIGIAGHRDGFFRALKDIEVGDVVQISLSHSDDTYVVNTVLIVKPEDISVLRDRSGAGLTLVTCYPFYFVGHAPTRFIVEASLKERIPRVPSAASNRTPAEKSR
jgi:sortase A